MDLFSITCSTCNARLTVRSMAAIGQILACPKCQSMVQIVAPAGWAPPSANGRPAASNGSQRPQTTADGSPARRVAQVSGKATSSQATSASRPDSDFSDPLPGTSAEPSQTHEPGLLPKPVTSRSEVIGKRVALTTGLTAGVALMLFVLLRPGADQQAMDRSVSQAADTDRRSRDQSGSNDAAISGTEAEVTQTPLAAPSGEASDRVQKSAEKRAVDDQELSAGDNSSLPSAAQPPVSTVGVDPKRAEDQRSIEAPSDSQATVAAEPQISASTEQDAPQLTSEVSPEDRAVAARLEERIAAIDFQSAKLSDLVEFLARMANVTLRFDPEALVAANVETTAQVSVRQTETTVERALDAALAKLGLTHEIRDGQVVIVTRPDPPTRRQSPAGDNSAVSDKQPGDVNPADPEADLRLEAVKP